MMSPSNRVLVLANEPMIAALIGMLVETTGRNPVFASAGEAPRDAVNRLRPLAVVLVDASLDEAHSDFFFAVLGRLGIGCAVFDTEHRARSIAEIAAERAIPWFTMPPMANELARAIAVASGDTATARGPDRRENPDATVASDGTRILRDREGHRWMIYDRRRADDRRGTTESELSPTTRVFVSDDGHRVECGVNQAEAADMSAITLEVQLHRAR
jgi:hypothetical protein